MINLIKSDRSRQELSSEYLVANIGIDTDENEPLEVHLIFKLWDLIFADPPRLASPGFSLRVWYMNNDPRSFEGPWGKQTRLHLVSQGILASPMVILGHRPGILELFVSSDQRWGLSWSSSAFSATRQMKRADGKILSTLSKKNDLNSRLAIPKFIFCKIWQNSREL